MQSFPESTGGAFVAAAATFICRRLRCARSPTNTQERYLYESRWTSAHNAPVVVNSPTDAQATAVDGSNCRQTCRICSGWKKREALAIYLRRGLEDAGTVQPSNVQSFSRGYPNSDHCLPTRCTLNGQATCGSSRSLRACVYESPTRQVGAFSESRRATHEQVASAEAIRVGYVWAFVRRRSVEGRCRVFVHDFGDDRVLPELVEVV